MSRLIHLAAATLFAAAAAASLLGLATAQETASTVESCKAAICFIALF